MTQQYNDEEDDENLQEAEYHKKSDYSQAGMVSEAVTKIKESRGKEMKSGYFNITTQPNGSIKKEYVGDTRKEYAGSIEYLKSLLTNEIATSERGKKALKEFQDRSKKCFDNYSVNLQVIRNERVVTLNKKYIPEMDTAFFKETLMQDRKTLRVRIDIEQTRGVYNPAIKMYWDEMVEIYDYLFQELNILIAEKNFFKQSAGF